MLIVIYLLYVKFSEIIHINRLLDSRNPFSLNKAEKSHKTIEAFLMECAIPYRGSLRLGRGAMTFPTRTSLTEQFEVGEIIQIHVFENVVIRKHSSGSFTALIDGKPEPARQHLLKIRDDMGLPDKATNTTRSLGSQVFGYLQK